MTLQWALKVTSIELELFEEYCNEHVCLSVCHVACHILVLLWRLCNTSCRPTSGFVDDVTFSQNGLYGADNTLTYQGLPDWGKV